MDKNDVLKELGEFIEYRMFEREQHLKQTGKLKRNRSMSRTQLAEMVGISKMWMTQIINGDKVASSDILLKIANVLDIEEHTLFKTARIIHPSVLEQCKKKYLKEYYIEGLD